MSDLVHHLNINEKYRLYEASVQNPQGDIEFLNKEYESLFGRLPHSLREDFGGTGFLACEWVKTHPKNTSYAIDLDTEPLSYGKQNHYARLTSEQQSRVHYIEGNVLASYHFKTDIIVAFNFSFYILKKRQELLEYFKTVRQHLNEEGLFSLDLFGGTDAYSPLEEETEHDDHSYFWDCDTFNPITNECLYYIHFKDNKKNIRYNKVFTYDWRMWSMAELIDLLAEAGFSQIHTYWEGEDEEGEGNGEFTRTREAQNCESWVSYIVALK